jgi:hypothetical protein
MYVMRYTVIDEHGTVSFVAPCHALLALAAACSKDPRTLDELLIAADRYDRGLRDAVMSGLAVFDEHNVGGQGGSIVATLSRTPAYRGPVFRVVDEVTREYSLQPVKAGVVIFNLRARRIVQIHNTYEEVLREGRSQIHDERGATKSLFYYRLPKNWMVVP